MKKTLSLTLFFLLALSTFSSFGQQDSQQKLKVFVDCAGTRCDMDYFRSEINVIDFFRDRLLSDVHVLITSNRNPSGGRFYQMIFYGLNELSNMRDTINFTTKPNSTDFEQREDMLNSLKRGLLPYIATTKYGEDIKIDMKVDGLEESNRPLDLADKWDYWVFRLSGDGSYNEDANYINLNLSGRVTVSRITEKNKFFISYSANERSRKFKFGDPNEEDLVVANNSNSLYNEYVFSISDHLSVGYKGSYRDDTFRNYKRNFTFSPTIEYSVFPYSDFNTKFLTVQYSAGLWSSVYNDTTIFNKIEETRFRHQLAVNADFNQKWGNLGVGARFMHYLDDINVNNLSLEARMDIRITGGLFFNFRIDGSLVHDQLNLAKGEASEEDILTQVRQLQTNFDFGSRIGISYRFGSNLNNIVNPRFDD